MKKTIRLPGKKHSMPKCFEEALYKLESIEGIEQVGIGRFGDKGNKNYREEYQIKYYNESTRTFKITVNEKGFSQDFYLKINPLHKETIEQKVNNYNKEI